MVTFLKLYGGLGLYVVNLYLRYTILRSVHTCPPEGTPGQVWRAVPGGLAQAEQTAWGEERLGNDINTITNRVCFRIELPYKFVKNRIL